jgi:hypothetical protein
MSPLAEEYMASDKQLFVILAAGKSDYCRVVPGQLVSFHLHLDFFFFFKCISSRFMRPSAQGYLAFIELLLSILAA